MQSADEQVLDTLRGKPPQTFKQLRWKLALAAAGLVMLLFIFLALFGLFELQRSSAADVENKEWRQLQQVVEQLQNEAGAHELYLQLGPRIQACPTEDDFRRALDRDRFRLESLPSHVPRMLWGRASCTVQDHGKARMVWITYRNTKGLRISGRWENGSLQSLSVN